MRMNRAVSHLTWFIPNCRTKARHSEEQPEFMAAIGYIVPLSEALAGLYPARDEDPPIWSAEFDQRVQFEAMICTQRM
jgi:hypothetical protein